MKRVVIITFIITAFNVFSYNLHANEKKSVKEKKRIAVLNFSANNVPLFYARIVRNFLELSLYNHGFYLLEREQIEKVSNKLNIRKNVFSDTNSAIEISKKLSTDFAIVGSIDRVDEYIITIRVINVDNGRILFAYSRVFESEKDIESNVNELSDSMSKDIKYYIKTGNTNIFEDIFHNVFISARFDYINPVGEFKEIVKPGYGFTLECGIETIFVENMIIGFEVGYYRFIGSLNNSDTCTFVPVLLNFSYRFNIFRIFNISPFISSGPTFITLEHGEGDGFAIEDNSKETAIEPLLKAGVFFGFRPNESLNINFGMGYGAVLEKENKRDFIIINLSVLFTL